MRTSLIAAAAAFGLVTWQAASVHPSALYAQAEQRGVQTTYQTAWVDHTRAAGPGDYTADAGSTGSYQTAWVDHTRAAGPGDYTADAGSTSSYQTAWVDHTRAAGPGDYTA